MIYIINYKHIRKYMWNLNFKTTAHFFKIAKWRNITNLDNLRLFHELNFNDDKNERMSMVIESSDFWGGDSIA